MGEAFESPRPQPARRSWLLGEREPGSQLVSPMEVPPPGQGDPSVPERREGPVTVDEAKQILGEQMVKGPEAIQKTFGIKLEAGALPPIPFDRARLEQAARQQMRLVLRIGDDGQGKPLTIERMRALYRETGNKELIEGWYPGTPVYEERFFREEQPESRWVLVGRYLTRGLGSADPFQQAEARLEQIGKRTADTTKRIAHLKQRLYAAGTHGPSDQARACREALEALYREFPEARPARSASEVVYDAALFGGSQPAYQGYKTAENNPTTGAGFHTATPGKGYIHVADSGHGQVKLTDLTGQGWPYQTGMVAVETE